MIIIKIGGGKTIDIEAIVEDLKTLDEPYLIVHGANFVRDELAKNLGKEKKILTSVSGYESVFSDKDAIEVIMMAYSGLQNKKIVELCQKKGINAIGLSGIDGQLIKAKRNRGIRVHEDGKKKIKRDFSGKPLTVNKELLHYLLAQKYVPVLCIPLLDEEGCAVNSENDDIVRVLKNKLGVHTIIQFIEAPGFLADRNDPSSRVSKMSIRELEERESQVQGRMKRKMLALRKLFEQGSCTVYISDGRINQPIQNALRGEGTVIS